MNSFEIDPNQPDSPLPATTAGIDPALQVCIDTFGMTAMTPDEFLELGIEALNQSVTAAVRAGAAFWAAQASYKEAKCAGGALVEFQDWIAEKGLIKRRVYECIAIAKFYGRTPAAKRSKLLGLGKKSSILLASLPVEVINEAEVSGADLIEEASLQTYPEMKARVDSLVRREANYEAELERMRLKVSRLEKTREPVSPFLIRTEDIRAECLWHQEEAEVNLNSLRKLFDDVNVDPGAGEWRYQIEQIWLTANFVAAQAASLVHACRDMCAADDLPMSVESTHMMTAQEAARWLDDAELVKSQYSGRKAARDLLRQKAQEAAGIKKRGRPAKVRGV